MHFEKVRWLRSLKLQLMATYLVAWLLTAALAAAVLEFALTWHGDYITSRGLKAQAAWIEESLQFDAAGKPVALRVDSNAHWIYESAPKDVKFRVIDFAGQVVFATEPGARALAPVGLTFDLARPMFSIEIGGVIFYVLTTVIEHKGSTFYVQTARSDRLNLLARRAIGRPALVITLWVGAASLMVFAAVVYLTLARTLRPVRRASEEAARIEPRNLSARLTTRDLPAEFAPLVNAFNSGLDRLERGYRVQQDFLVGAAHELKTPLALLRSQIEVDGGAERATLLRDVDRMARQVVLLLRLAEVSEVQNYILEPTDLTAAAVEVTQYLSRLANRREVALRVQLGPTPALLRADRSATFVLIKNLVENAIQHSTAGGVVTLTIGVDEMKVGDEGSGIAEEDMPWLFVRFWRGVGRRDDGAGLGLAICREIANHHGWALTARNAEPGAEFILDFRSAYP